MESRRCLEFVSGFGHVLWLIEIRAMVALELFPIRRPARRRSFGAAPRAGLAAVGSFPFDLRVIVMVSGLRHDLPLASTAVVVVRIALIPVAVVRVSVVASVVAAIPVGTVAAVVTAIIPVTYWSEHTASEQGGEDGKNKNEFHIGSSFEK
jgi:hypothetical protein